jgi:glutathione S-transferase
LVHAKVQFSSEIAMALCTNVHSSGGTSRAKLRKTHEGASMDYHLAIGDRSYSSWSLRGWLLFDHPAIPVKTHLARLYAPDFAQVLADFAPARLVPALRLPSGRVVGETLAIAETLAERHPEAGLWPQDPEARAQARYMVSEMHAGFGALRSHCAMNLKLSYSDCAPTEAVLADVARIDQLWQAARAEFGAAGPWLFGSWTIADAFFAPVAARIAGHALSVSAVSAAYVTTTLADPSFRRWRAMGWAEHVDQAAYDRPWLQRAWPGPAPIPAQVSARPSVNALCPYSGKPVTDFLEMQGRVWGFCNPFCRDKTMADPEVWPAFMAMVAEKA